MFKAIRPYLIGFLAGILVLGIMGTIYFNGLDAQISADRRNQSAARVELTSRIIELERSNAEIGSKLTDAGNSLREADTRYKEQQRQLDNYRSTVKGLLTSGTEFATAIQSSSTDSIGLYNQAIFYLNRYYQELAKLKQLN